MTTVYLNGRFIPADEATVPVLDRGFIFGDGVYEVIPIFNGKLFRLPEHLRRLGNSLAGVAIDPPVADAGWRTILDELVARNPQAASVYLEITRGVAARDLMCPAGVPATVLAMTMPGGKCSTPEPISAAIVEDIRWQRCDLKVISLLPNVLLKIQAKQRGADDAILARGEVVTEAASSNIFAVVDGEIRTPAQSVHLLPGVTRDLIVELLKATAVPVRELELRVSDLRRASEIFLSSSLREVVPVTRLDGQLVGTGRPGPEWQRVQRRYREFRDAY